MNRTQALKEAARLFGKKAAVEDKGKSMASTPEQRAAAVAESKRIRSTIPEGQRPTKEQRDELNRLLCESGRYRYSVGTIEGIAGMGLQFFSVQGQGDTWEEAFAKARRMEPKAA